MAGGPSCCDLGEWKVMVQPLPTFRYEFPNRLQHHDYLPGKPLPPAPGPLRLIFRNCLLAASVMQADPWAALLARGLRPARPELGEGVEFAASCALRPSCPRRPAKIGSPTQASISPHSTLCFHGYFRKGSSGRWSQRAEPVPWEKGAVPKAPRSFWSSLTDELWGSVLPGAECASGQSGLAPGFC